MLSADKSTATIGMGQVSAPNHVLKFVIDNDYQMQTWAQVYEILDGSGVNVVGGRTPGPGVGGFTIGGGFSW